MSPAAGSADARTIAHYDRDADGYARWSEEVAPRACLERFMARLPEGGTALDLGCGGGWASTVMAARGLRVDAIDASGALVAEARARGVPARVGRFEDLNATAAYDGVWACCSLLHTPRAAMPGLLARVRRALRPGGTLCLGLKDGEGEARDRLGRLYVYWSESAIRAALEAAGFEGIEIARDEGVGRDGRLEPLLDAFARA